MGDSRKMLQVRSKRQVPVRVMLLDDEVFNDSIDKRAIGWVLFERVCESLNIIETDYFGLTYIDPTGLKFWLNNDKKIVKQMKGMNWDFKFEIKFYPPDPSQLTEDLTRYQVCLQIRRDMVNEKLPCSFVTYTLLGSYTAQSELGDFDTEEFGHGTSYLKDIKFAPHQDRELLQKIAELHRQHKGQTPEEAELHFLENAKKLAMYGVELHNAQDAEGEKIKLGVCASGLIVYKDKVQMNRFVWPKVLKISYRRKKYYIKIRPGEFEEFASLIGFRLDSITLAKRLWKISIEHHSFFRFRETEPTKKVGLIPRFGSRFRYSGRTQFQSRQAVLEADREAPQFDRVLSKRGTFSARTTTQRQKDEEKTQRRDMRERERQRRERLEPSEPTKPPPMAPKPKPLPRGPPSVEDDLSEKGHPDSINDSFEDVPDRRSKIERIHGVPTPLSAVLQMSMEKSDHKSDHEEDSNSHGPPGYMTDDPEDRRHQVRRLPDIDNSSMYLFSYPSSIDSNLSETCGDYDACKPLSAHRCRTASESNMTWSSKIKASNLHTSVTSIPEGISGGHYEEIHGCERIYDQISGVKRDRSFTSDGIEKQNNTHSNSQPKIYGRRSKHYTKNQKQTKLTPKLISSQPSLQNVAMASLLPNKGMAASGISNTPPLYAKINKDLCPLEKLSKALESKVSHSAQLTAEERPRELNAFPLAEKQNRTFPSQNRDKIREELKMYILSPQTKENSENSIRENDSNLCDENNKFTKAVDNVDKIDNTPIEKRSDYSRNSGLQSADQNIAIGNLPKLAANLSDMNHVESGKNIAGKNNECVFIDTDEDGRTKSNECQLDTAVVVENHSDKGNPPEDKTSASFLLGRNSKRKNEVNQATREWVDKIETSFEETENDHNVGVKCMIKESDIFHTKTEVDIVNDYVKNNGSVHDPAKSDAKLGNISLLSPAIVVSDCDRDAKAEGRFQFVSPYQIVFDSSIKVMLASDGQEVDFDTQLERFSNLSSGSSDKEMPLRGKYYHNDVDRLSTTSDQDRDLEQFSTISSESGDLELRYGRKDSADDRDISRERFCTLSTDSSEADPEVTDMYQYGGTHLTIPTKKLRKKQKKQIQKVEDISSSHKRLEESDSTNSLELEKESEGNTHDIKEAEKQEMLVDNEKLELIDKAKCLDTKFSIEQSEDISDKPKLSLDFDSLTSNTNSTGAAAQEPLENVLKADKQLKKNRSKDKLQSSMSESVQSISTDEKVKEDSASKYPLKKSKSKDKLGLGLSCMKPRTTSPFEAMFLSNKDYMTPKKETVKTEKSKSVYRKVATQLSKPFVKKKSKSKIQDEVDKTETQKTISTAQAAKDTSSYQLSKSGSMRKTVSAEFNHLENSPRPRYNKPDWFKTYLLPDDQKTKSLPVQSKISSKPLSQSNEQIGNSQFKESQKTGGILGDTYDSFPTDKSKISLDSFVSKQNWASDKTQNSKVLDGRKETSSRQSESKSNNSKKDQLKLGLASRKKVSPGVIHMLNPCSAGWLEGGLEADKCKAAKPKMALSELDADRVDSKLYDKDKCEMQVSALDFDLTASDFNSISMGKNKMTVNEMISVGNAGSYLDRDQIRLSLPENTSNDKIDQLNALSIINQDLTENREEDYGNNIHCIRNTDQELENQQPHLELMKPCQLVEDLLCHRKWTYKAAKDQNSESQDDFTKRFARGKVKVKGLSAVVDSEVALKSDPTNLNEQTDGYCKETKQSCESIEDLKIASTFVDNSQKKTSQHIYNSNLNQQIECSLNDVVKENAVDRVEQRIVVDDITLDSSLIMDKKLSNKVASKLLHDNKVIKGLNMSSTTKDDHCSINPSSSNADHQRSDKSKTVNTDVICQTKDIGCQDKIETTSDEDDDTEDIHGKDVNNDNHGSGTDENEDDRENVSGSLSFDMQHTEQSESHFDNQLDPLDDGNIPFADDDSTNDGGQMFSEYKVNSDCKKGFPNGNFVKQDEIMCNKDLSLDPILCECNFKSEKVLDKAHYISTKAASYVADENIVTENIHTNEHNAKIDSEHFFGVKKFANNQDSICNEDVSGTILCECNFRSVQVTDLDGASWYEEDGEIETKNSYSDDRVPVIVEEFPFVPKKRILKSSYSADNITKVDRKKGVRFHANLPTWKKDSWRSESSLRRTRSTDCVERKDDEKKKKEYIQNFIMCMFEQEPRNLALMGDALDNKDPLVVDSGKKLYLTEDHDVDEKNVSLKGQKTDQPILLTETNIDIDMNFAKDLFVDEQKSTEMLKLSQAEGTTLGHHIDGNEFDKSKLEREPYNDLDDFGIHNDDGAFTKPLLHGLAGNVFELQSCHSNDHSVSVTVLPEKSKKPSMIAKQFRPHSPKFLVPISHQRSRSASDLNCSIAQISGSEPNLSFTTESETIQQHRQYDLTNKLEPSTADQKPFSFNENRIKESRPSRRHYSEEVNKLNYELEATQLDYDQSYGIETKPYTDWKTYLKSYEDFRKKMDMSDADVKDSEERKREVDYNTKSTNNPNTVDYADVSVIGAKTEGSLMKNKIIPSHEGTENVSNLKNNSMLSVEAPNLFSGQCDENIKPDTVHMENTLAAYKPFDFPSENNIQTLQPFDSKDTAEILENAYEQLYVEKDKTIKADNSLFDNETENLATTAIIPESPSSCTGKTTRYIFSLPDETDPESPKIKSVTYEYVTEYRLNKVKVDYQHSKKVQTETNAIDTSYEDH